MLNLMKLNKWTENTPIDGDKDTPVVMVSPALVMAIEELPPNRERNYGRRTRIDYMTATGPHVALVQETAQEIMLQSADVSAMMLLHRKIMQPKEPHGTAKNHRPSS
tara:strand:- start:28086 stop:28406 length:321 start_codon:yes stop_codon:yes gene_type:complete